MDWIDNANQKLASARAREAAIVEHESEIYELLWSELKLHVDAARAKGFPGLFTNGSPLSRVIGIDHLNRITIALDKGRHVIAARTLTGIADLASFTIDVCKDGVVCLRFEGKEISLKEAAIRVLWPFLYPELPPYPGPGSKGQEYA